MPKFFFGIILKDRTGRFPQENYMDCEIILKKPQKEEFEGHI